MDRFSKTGTRIEITDAGKTITNVSNTHATCYGALSIPSTEPFCHRWRFKINKEWNGWTCIGITTNDQLLDERFYLKNPQSSYQACNKLRVGNKTTSPFPCRYGTGDIIEMILDLSVRTPRLMFRLIEPLERPECIYEVIAAESVRIQDGLTYVMAVALSCKADSLTLVEYSNNKHDLAEQKELELLRMQVTKLRTNNNALQVANTILQQELQTLRLPRVLTYISEQDVQMEDVVAKKQKALMQKINIHDKRLQEWKCHTENVRKQYDSIANDEEKEQDTNTSELLNNYIRCKQLWVQQEMRMEDVVTHCSHLNQLKKDIKADSLTYHQKVEDLRKSYIDASTQYKNCNKNRIDAEKLLNENREQTKQAIEKENSSNHDQCMKLDEYNTCSLESKNLDKILTTANAFMKGYHDFDEHNEQRIKKIKTHFETKWTQCMRNWFQWTSEDIVCWISYLSSKNELTLSNNTNLEIMKKSKMNGESLVGVHKSDLTSVGFDNLNDVQQIYQKISELISKYPQRNDGHELLHHMATEGDKVRSIPKEYICPLSNQIMRKPVRIFDNHTYERSAIAKYLEEHKKSPITNEICDEDDEWILPNRKLQEKIDIFLSQNPKFAKTELISNPTDYIK
eukprot:124910_1